MASKPKTTNPFDFASSMSKQLDKYRSSQEKTLGLPQLRDTANNLQTKIGTTTQTLNALPENVKNETRGFDVNNAQLSEITTEKSKPLTSELSNLGTTYNATANRLNTAENTLNTNISNFSQGLKSELDSLMMKWQNDQAMSLEEKKRLSDLAKAERDFEKQKELIGVQSAADIAKYNATTGKNNTPTGPWKAPNGGQAKSMPNMQSGGATSSFIPD